MCRVEFGQRVRTSLVALGWPMPVRVVFRCEFCDGLPDPLTQLALERGLRLTAETVIATLEDAEDYKAFEAAIVCSATVRADYPQGVRHPHSSRCQAW